MTEERDPPQKPVMTRREALFFVGALGLGSVAAACTRRLSSATPTAGSTSGAGTASSNAAPGCVLTPEVTEGPYYLPLHLVRGDITEGKPGLPLELDLQVVNATTCKPISGAAVDIWHADALGVYSGVVPLGAGSSAQSTPGTTFLRGIQSTNGQGEATFRTIYPGWYTGRAVHIHVKVHLGDQTVHTGQLFLQDALTATVYGRAPYNTRPGPDMTNQADSIYQQAGAAAAILAMKQQGSGYVASMVMGVRA